jgi:hypothetical protein
MCLQVIDIIEGKKNGVYREEVAQGVLLLAYSLGWSAVRYILLAATIRAT